MARIKYGESRISDEKACYFCGAEFGLDRHEFLNACDKPHAVEDGLWVYVCRKCHTLYQNNSQVMNAGRRKSQMVYEEQIGTREEFMKRYRKNYL